MSFIGNPDELEFIREQKSGEEKVYRCPHCQKPKLYINQQTFAWFCFVCGVGGRIGYGWTKDRKDVFEPKEFFWLDPTEEDYKRAETVLQTRHIKLPEQTRKNIGIHSTSLNCLSVPLYLHGQVVGIHTWWHPTSPHQPRYTTVGRRGIKWFEGSRRSALLFEGLFDYLSYIQWMLCQSLTFPCAVFTVGNTLSPEQVDHLMVLLKEYTTIWVGFDNDKPEAYHRVCAALENRGPWQIRPYFPPGFYKDWDEAIHAITAEGRIKLLELQETPI